MTVRGAVLGLELLPEPVVCGRFGLSLFRCLTLDLGNCLDKRFDLSNGFGPSHEGNARSLIFRLNSSMRLSLFGKKPSFQFAFLQPTQFGQDVVGLLWGKFKELADARSGKKVLPLTFLRLFRRLLIRPFLRPDDVLSVLARLSVFSAVLLPRIR